ncbi:hypothetical protein VXN63_04930 [Marinilactibacillus sp. XAAS-LB27]|uniref:hypothetical protein n=1 Tax=Marinilactibacillus sp. XAAS-LB27 TaxID=3114538 RepID=UPI002E17138D|nr:hypothetical protein [Marinilactibacillus sp. XAAS-LB27]
MKKTRWSTLLLLFLIAGCSSLKETVEAEPETEQVEEIGEAKEEVEVKEELYTYKEYEELFQLLKEQLTIDDLKIIAIKDAHNFRILDEKQNDTDNKSIPIEGDEEFLEDPALRIVYLENSERSNFISINMIYHDEVFDMSDTTEQQDNEFLIQTGNFQASSISFKGYKNLEIIISAETNTSLEDEAFIKFSDKVFETANKTILSY